MVAYENVQVTAACEGCNAHGKYVLGSGVAVPCAHCKGSKRVTVPVSEWAAALATVEGVETTRLTWCLGDFWASSAQGGSSRPAVVLPASASTEERTHE